MSTVLSLQDVYIRSMFYLIFRKIFCWKRSLVPINVTGFQNRYHLREKLMQEEIFNILPTLLMLWLLYRYM
jgi:hypothetical protein